MDAIEHYLRRMKLNLLVHYICHGQNESRQPVSKTSTLALDVSRIDPKRETVLLIVSQTTRTGGPVLGYNIAKRLRQRYNVVALLLVGGELVDDYKSICNAVIGPITQAEWHPAEINPLIGRILTKYRISYAIANTIDCRVTLQPLTLALVPVVTLVHEFASHFDVKGEMGRALEWSTHTVFSAKIVADSVRADYPSLDSRVFHILPQGPSELPPRERTTLANEERLLRQAMRPSGAEDAFVVLGCGTIATRKGVDIFLSCAAAVAELKPLRQVRFVWIGRGADADPDRKRYEAALRAQISRFRLDGSVTILDEVQDLNPAYAEANLFFISSRLDPLPNVAIDAALRGVPIVCFDNASGFSELLGGDPVTRRGVVPHHFGAAAVVIATLADDRGACTRMGEKTQSLAAATFDMDRYVNAIDGIGRDAMRIMRQRREDLQTLSVDSSFDMSLFQEPELSFSSRHEAICFHLARSAVHGTDSVPTRNFHYRRPCPGFHPQVYAYEHRHLFDPTVINPLAHFVRSGKPKGPWKHEVIEAGGPNPNSAASPLRVAIHGHFYYPQLAVNFVRKLSVNRTRCDILLSTSSPYKAWILWAATRKYRGGQVSIRVVPNRGRDIGAFLAAYAGDFHRYDAIGHIHGKRSRHQSSERGHSWREFAWQNLVGGRYPMMDTILERMAQDENLGLVFPSDPHLSDWDHNREIAEDLARKMDIKDPLPPFFDFPVGTMFWTRPKALQPLFDLNVDGIDYPEEPVPVDGTILHALERLLPFVAQRSGYRCAVTHVPAMTW